MIDLTSARNRPPAAPQHECADGEAHRPQEPHENPHEVRLAVEIEMVARHEGQEDWHQHKRKERDGYPEDTSDHVTVKRWSDRWTRPIKSSA